MSGLQKCSGCKCKMLLETYFSKNRKGEYFKTCDGCRKKRKERDTERNIANKDKFECDKCDNKFPANNQLQRHIKAVHDKIKDHECQQCDAKFSINHDLQKHIKRVHDKIKDHECQQCDFKASEPGDLRTHIKMVHDKIKDRSCPKCDFKASTNGQIDNHIKQVHDKINKFVCQQCDFKCPRKDTLQMHIKSLHDKIKDFECPKCEYKFSFNGKLQRHIKICTGDRQGSSGECKIEDCLIEMKIEHKMRTSYELKNEADYWLFWDCMIKYDDKILFIEYDGAQHFKPVEHWGGQEAFEKLKQNDELKNKYCKDNNYPLLRIPHTEFGNIPQLITDFICNHTNWGCE